MFSPTQTPASRTLPGWLALVACALLAAACSDKAKKTTSLLVRVRGDIAASDIASVDADVELLEASGKATGRTDRRTWQGAQAKLPFSFGVEPARSAKGLDALVTLELRKRDGSRLRSQARTAFVEGETRLVEITLIEACMARSCPADETCDVCGECKPVRQDGVEVDPTEVDLNEPLACTGPSDGDDLPDGGGMDDGSVIDPAGDGGTRDPTYLDCSANPGDCIAEVRVSLSHACAVTKGGALYCWSMENTCGELGPTSAADGETLIVSKLADEGIVHAAPGNQFTCVLTDGSVWDLEKPSVVCWGRNTSAQLGTRQGAASDNCGAVPDSSANPKLPEGANVVAGLPAIRQLRAYDNQVFGLTSAGKAWYWGDDVGPDPMPFVGSATWKQLEDGHDVSIGRGDGRWVLDRWSQEVYADETLLDAANLEAWGMCVVTAQGRIDCQSGWLDTFDPPAKTQGELGRAFLGWDEKEFPKYATPPNERAPIDMPEGSGGNTGFTQVSGAGGQLCALRNGGELWCWGLDQMDQFGLGEAYEESPVWQPMRIGEHDDWVAIEVGGNRTCGIRADRSLWCAGWGHDPRGAFREMKLRK